MMDLCVWSIIWEMIHPSCRQHVSHTAKAQRNSAKTKHSSGICSVITTRRLSRCAKSNYTYAYRWIAGANGSGTALRMSMNIPPAILLLSMRRKERNPKNGDTGYNQPARKRRTSHYRARNVFLCARIGVAGIHTQSVQRAHRCRDRTRTSTQGFNAQHIYRAYWKIDLRNLLHFLALRMEAHAQYEIRTYAATIGNEIVSKWCPMVWKAFQDYLFSSIELSKQEIAIISRVQAGDRTGARAVAEEYGLVPPPGKR